MSLEMSTAMDLLTASRRVIRSRARTSSYWSAAEKLTQLWVGDPLLSSAELHVAGADLGGIIDWLYDQNIEAGEAGAEALVGLTQRLQEMTDLETATREVRRLEAEGLGEEASVEDATRAIIAVLTMAGVEALTRRGSAELALRWQRAWADFMGRQNLEQQRICGIGFLPRLSPDAQRRCMQTLGLGPEDLVPRATSFSEGVEEFLLRYGETSAGSVTLLGSLAFSALPLEELNGLLELCTGPRGLLPLMARLLRLAPDVSFDPAEAINTGVFAVAAEQRRSLIEVIGHGRLEKPYLDTRLRGEWARISSRLRDEMQACVSSHGARAGTATAITIVEALSELVQILVPGTWKQGVNGGVSSSSSRSSTHLRDAAHASDTASLVPLVRDHFRALLADRGDWNHSIYDMAWVLCCGFFDRADRQKHLARMLSWQAADGTWGDASYMPHSALLDTLGAVMALVRMDRPVPRQNELRASVEALLLRCCDYPHHDTVAFELLVPKLVAWLEQNHFSFSLCARARGFVEELDRKGDGKLHILRRMGSLFDAGSTLSFAAELAALVPLAPEEVDRLLGMMLPNGAIGLSPAATAAVCLLLAEQKRDVPDALYQYLRDTFADYREEGFPNLHPIVTSRRLWNARSWLISGNIFEIARDEAIRAALVRIYEETNVDAQGRVSWDTNNAALPDLDDTAVAFALQCALRRMGVQDLRPMTTSGILRFRRKDGTFFCYPHEMHPSPSSLLHSLLSLELGEEAFGAPFAEHPDTRSISRGMLEQLRPDGQGFERIHHDKWHATWTYGVQKWLSLRSVRAAYPAEVKKIFTEVMAREQDGGWGQKAPTLEETAYVVSGLTSLLKGGGDLLSAAECEELRGALDRSRRFMRDALRDDDPSLPALWISKNMYTPRFQIVSSVLDALYGLASL